jgi:hypothetical protein
VILPRAHGQDDTRAVPGADDHVLRFWGALHEVALPQRPFLTLDDQERLAGEHEKGFCLRFPVVHRIRLARLQDGQVGPEHREVRVGVVRTGESQALPSRAVVPARIARGIPTIQLPYPLGSTLANRL